MSLEAMNQAYEASKQNSEAKKLYAIAVEKGLRRIPDLIYTHAKCREDVLASLVVMTANMPKRTRVVNVAECVGYLSDDKGRILV